jgi:penicillin-binding protein 1C
MSNKTPPSKNKTKHRAPDSKTLTKPLATKPKPKNEPLKPPRANKPLSTPKPQPEKPSGKTGLVTKKISIPRIHHHRWFKLKIIIPAIILILVLSSFFIYLVVGDLPSPAKLSSQAYPVSTQIFDRNGILLYEIYADRNRTPITLNSLPPYIKQATISIEDKDFYHHIGFSLQGITRALKNTLFNNRLQGGSTITQQLVKTSLLTPERTIQRKIKEAILTIGTEFFYSKDQILEMYLNNIPYGGTAWGIESAAKTYFGKSAKDLSLAEAALLAGLPAAPSKYSPFGSNPGFALSRQQEVLRRMAEEKYITKEQADSAAGQELQFNTEAIPIKAPHFVLYVKDLLTEKYTAQRVERGGLRVITSLDLNLQTDAESSVAAQLKSLEKLKVGNAAALITKPDTGEILAMVGSRDYFDNEHGGQVNVTLRPRQPGSSIKPLNYVTALQLKKATAATMFLDLPTCFSALNQPPYCPKNYDGSFHGPVQLRFALGNSLNIPAVKTLALNSLESFIATASAMGISTFNDPSQYGLSLTLGGGEVTMMDMATAFGVLANQGIKVPLHPILQVTDWQNNLLENYQAADIQTSVQALNHDDQYSEPGASQTLNFTDVSATLTRVLNRAPAYIISHILLDNNAREAAFGPKSKLIIPNQVVSVKTGTTNSLRDNWTIGYTPHYLVAVWVGNNDNSPMNPYLVSGVTGAAPIWNDLMTNTLKDQPSLWPEKPDDVLGRTVCTTSGLVSHPDYPCSVRNEFFWTGSEPGTFDPAKKDIVIKNDTGLPASPGDTENTHTENHTLLSDPIVQDYCADCTRPLDDQGKPIPVPAITIPYPLPPNPVSYLSQTKPVANQP